MKAPKPGDFPLLLQVFRAGVRVGLISKNEVVAWADDIIVNAVEPDYFFIELSLSHDVNGIIEVLNKYVVQDKNPIYNRVI